MGELAMEYWLIEAITSGMNASAFSRKVSAYLADKRIQQTGQGRLFSTEPSADERMARARRVVAQEMLRGLYGFREYARTVHRLTAEGVLGKGSYLGPYLSAEERERFSPRSPIRIWVEVLEIVKDMTLLLTQLSRDERLGYVRKLTRGHHVAEEAFGVLAQAAAYEERGVPH